MVTYASGIAAKKNIDTFDPISKAFLIYFLIFTNQAFDISLIDHLLILEIVLIICITYALLLFFKNDLYGI